MRASDFLLSALLLVLIEGHSVHEDGDGTKRLYRINIAEDSVVSDDLPINLRLMLNRRYVKESGLWRILSTTAKGERRHLGPDR